MLVSGSPDHHFFVGGHEYGFWVTGNGNGTVDCLWHRRVEGQPHPWEQLQPNWQLARAITAATVKEAEDIVRKALIGDGS